MWFGTRRWIVTTPDAAGPRLDLRLHSGCGVLYEYPVPANNGFPLGTGGMGGGFFGGGGAMGGGGMGGSMGGGMLGGGTIRGGMGGMGGGFLGGTRGLAGANLSAALPPSGVAVEEPKPETSEASPTDSSELRLEITQSQTLHPGVPSRRQPAGAGAPAGPLLECARGATVRLR